RRSDAEPQRHEHRAALGDHGRDEVGQVAVAGVAMDVGEAKQDVETRAPAEADLHVEPGRVAEEQAESEVRARRRGSRGDESEHEGHGQELAHASSVASRAGTQVAAGFAYRGTSRDSQPVTLGSAAARAAERASVADRAL